jgi:hypothetical protein
MLRFVATPAEARALLRCAHVAGQSFSAWIRALGLRAVAEGARAEQTPRIEAAITRVREQVEGVLDV